MKKLFSFVAAALMSASMFAQPATVPTVQDLSTAGYDVTYARVIVLYFDEQVCNDIVWAGSYNEWSTTPVDMMTFESLEGFEGWYVIELWDDSDPCQGKPVQLKKDGSFNWDFQSGDVEAWINMAQPGTQTASFEAGYSGEANCTWPTTGAYIYEVEYFKNHNTPCGEDKPKHNYTITAYLPQFCDAIAAYADSVRVMGGFDNWTNGIWMEKKIDEDFNDCWYAEIKDVEEGTEFKLRFGTDADWKVQVQLNGQNLGNERTGETTDIVLQFDGEGYGFAACAAAPVVGDKFEDADSGLKFKVTAVGEANTVMVIANSYTGTSYTVPATVSYQSVTFNVTEIGKEAFEECSSLESVTIPASVTTIGQDAFHDCESLQSVTLSEGLLTIGKSAFLGCESLLSVTLPEGLLTIGQQAFGNCVALQSITIPASVTTIGGYAFNGCESLQSVTLSENLTTIEEAAFYECPSLASITIPAGVTEIGMGAFAECTGLTSVTFLGNACQDAIGEMAFMSVGNPDPALLTLPNSWTGTLPDEDGNWYGGKFEMSSTPTALPSLIGDGVKGNKFMHNGQLFIRKNDKLYNAVGAEF